MYADRLMRSAFEAARARASLSSSMAMLIFLVAIQLQASAGRIKLLPAVRGQEPRALRLAPRAETYCLVYVITRLGLNESTWLKVVPLVVYVIVKFPGPGQQKVNAI